MSIFSASTCIILNHDGKVYTISPKKIGVDLRSDIFSYCVAVWWLFIIAMTLKDWLFNNMIPENFTHSFYRYPNFVAKLWFIW